jgi:RND family efflux transporter MFP subunit
MASRPAFAFAWLALVACDPGHSPPPVVKAPDEPLTQVTVWTDHIEVFLEHPVLVAGVPAAFATHLTDLRTLGPVGADPVVFVLRQGDAPPLEHTEAAPKRPGIYVPDLVFPRPGEASLSLRIRDQIVELPKLTVHAARGKARQTPAPEGVALLKEQQWQLGVRTEPVSRRRLVERVRVPAVVAAPPGRRVAVAPPVAGRLLAPEGSAFPALGGRVRAGQVLARVQSPFAEQTARLIETRAETVRAKLALEQADRILARVRKLAAGGARPERDVEEADFAQRTAKAAHEGAEAVQAAYEAAGGSILELRAAIDGELVAVRAAPGELVTPEAPVFQLLDASIVHLEARIPEPDLDRLAGGRPGLVELPGRRGSFFSLEGRARRIFFGPEVDAATRSVPLVFEAENPDGGLRIGGALTLHLETARAEEALAVPASAVVEEDARPIAFVQVSGETFSKRPLKLGLKDGPWIQVLGGLAEGERVVVKEAMGIRLASVSGAIPEHGHSH